MMVLIRLFLLVCLDGCGLFARSYEAVPTAARLFKAGRALGQNWRTEARLRRRRCRCSGPSRRRRSNRGLAPEALRAAGPRRQRADLGSEERALVRPQNRECSV